MHKGKIDKLAKHKLEKNLHRASYILFENDTRYLDFYNQFAKIFDDKVYDLINEGLCFTFEKTMVKNKYSTLMIWLQVFT